MFIEIGNGAVRPCLQFAKTCPITVLYWFFFYNDSLSNYFSLWVSYNLMFALNYFRFYAVYNINSVRKVKKLLDPESLGKKKPM